MGDDATRVTELGVDGRRRFRAGLANAGRFRNRGGIFRIERGADRVIFTRVRGNPRRIADVRVGEFRTEARTDLFVVQGERRVGFVRVGNDRFQDDGEGAIGIARHNVGSFCIEARHCVSICSI